MYVKNVIKFSNDAKIVEEMKKYFCPPSEAIINSVADTLVSDYVLYTSEWYDPEDGPGSSAFLFTKEQADQHIAEYEKERIKIELRKAAAIQQTRERQSQEWAAAGLCCYCGGKLSTFGRKCKSCGKAIKKKNP